jgi:predicted nuclease with TOPRIM domain
MFGASRSEKRVAELEATLQRLEAAFKKVELEWADTYEKFRRLYMRTCKRVKTLETLEPETVEGESSTAPIAPDEAQLSPKQLEAQRLILMRRNRNAAARPNGGG